MRMHVRTHGSSVAVIDLFGKLTAGNAIGFLEGQVDHLIRNNCNNIVLNMHSVERLDCAGVGALVRCFCRTREEGGALRLLHVPQRYRELLAIFRLDSILRAYDSEDVATGSFGVLFEGPKRQQAVEAAAVGLCFG